VCAAWWSSEYVIGETDNISAQKALRNTSVYSVVVLVFSIYLVFDGGHVLYRVCKSGSRRNFGGLGTEVIDDVDVCIKVVGPPAQVDVTCMAMVGLNILGMVEK